MHTNFLKASKAVFQKQLTQDSQKRVKRLYKPSNFQIVRTMITSLKYALYNKGAHNLIIPHIACDSEVSGCNVGRVVSFFGILRVMKDNILEVRLSNW